MAQRNQVHFLSKSNLSKRCKASSPVMGGEGPYSLWEGGGSFLVLPVFLPHPAPPRDFPISVELPGVWVSRSVISKGLQSTDYTYCRLAHVREQLAAQTSTRPVAGLGPSATTSVIHSSGLMGASFVLIIMSDGSLHMAL